MTLPVIEPDLWAAEDTLEQWARAVDEGPWSSLCFGERMAFDNPETSKSRPATHRPSLASLLLAAGFALLPLLLLPLAKALAGIVLAALAATWLAAKFQRWLGGYTGDCLGAVQQVTEVLFYLGLMANLGAPSA